MSSNVEFEAKIQIKRLAVSVEDENTQEPNIIVGT